MAKRILAAIVLATMPAGGAASQENPWKRDLDAFAKGLAERHKSPFHFTPKNAFDRSIADLAARIDTLDPDQIFVAMDRIAASVGDAHTYVAIPPDSPRFPLQIGLYGDDFRVTAVMPGEEAVLGTKIVAFGETPVRQVYAQALEIAANDENMPLRQGWTLGFMNSGVILHGLGVIPAHDALTLTLMRDDGSTFTHAMKAMGAAPQPAWVSARTKTPLARTRPQEAAWCEAIPASRAVYCNVRRYENLGDLSKSMRALSETADKLIIDLRQQTTGGDYFVGRKHLIEPLKAMPNVNRKGHLFVLVGPLTLSAAMSNAAHFRTETPAILVGRAIGEKPNSWQESDTFTLPNSKWTVSHSTKFYEFLPGAAENIIRPDQEIVPTWEQFKAGDDPALDWALAYRAP